jgi:hypothetical protein
VFKWSVHDLVKVLDSCRIGLRMQPLACAGRGWSGDPLESPSEEQYEDDQ